MWGPELPFRRYSVPETVMRKFRLRQSSSSSSDSSGRRVIRKHVTRVRHGRNRHYANTLTKSVQTSTHNPELVANPIPEREALPLNTVRRTSSVPDLSSDADGKDNQRPTSARDNTVATRSNQVLKGLIAVISPVGTPSPVPPSNYSSAFHRCDVYSNTWSYTSSEYTLGQSVTDRTTSTQDSTLSIQSSTPDSVSSTERAQQKLFLENSIFSPAGNFIAVHTESLLIHPIEIVERRENWNFGFSDTPDSDKILALPSNFKSVAINTEPPEMVSVRVDKSTCAYGMFNDKSAQVRGSDIENEFMIDKGTCIELLSSASEADEDLPENLVTYTDMGTNTDCIQQEKKVMFSTEPTASRISSARQQESVENLASRREAFQIPHIRIFQGSTTESQQTDDILNYEVMEKVKVYATKSTFVTEDLIKNSEAQKERCLRCHREGISERSNTYVQDSSKVCRFDHEATIQPYGGRRLCTDVACSACNYKDYPDDDGVVARFSAIPRSNSMLVNTSSIDYSSDSDLSLTDSLEDGSVPSADNYYRNETRHDSRLVRGEVSLDQQQSGSKQYPKGNKAYAYFLSISGEQDMVKQCPLPDWLKARLQRREEEIKRLFQDRFNKNQTIIYRRRKKILKRIKEENQDSNSTNNKEIIKQTIEPSSAVNLEETKDRKSIDKVVPSQPSTSRIDNTGTINTQLLDKVNQVTKIEPTVSIKFTEDQKQISNKDNSYVQISEIIKIEMLDSLNTVITKEKQINLSKNAFTKDLNHIQTSELIKNERNLNSQKIIFKTNVGNFDFNNKLLELQDDSSSVSSNKENIEKTTQEQNKDEKKTDVKLIIEKNHNEPYSFKQFRPLFQSKADDQTVAQILLSAMESDESVKAHELKAKEEKEIENESKFNKAEQEDRKAVKEVPNVKVERSSNTVTPYLSTFIQTEESFLKEKSTGDAEELVKTQTPLISCSAQTNESFIDNEISFIESDSQIKSKDQGTDAFEELSDSNTKRGHSGHKVSFNLNDKSKSVSIQTDQYNAAINQVKPLIIQDEKNEFKSSTLASERETKNYTSNKKPNTNADISRRPSKHYCKNEILYDHKSSQVLELIPQPCSCHMCTLNKKTRADKTTESVQNILQSKKKLQTRGTSTTEKKEEKKSSQKYPANKRSNSNINKFQRQFEAIPEERNSSNESMSEPQITPVTRKKVDRDTVFRNKSEELRIAEVENRLDKAKNTFLMKDCENIIHGEEVKSTQTSGGSSKKSNVVFGRFKAVKNENRSRSDGMMLADGIEVMQQYKGRAALAAAPTDAQEQLLTLSKGWINFYLLKDNQDVSDSNNDEVQSLHDESFVQRGSSPIRILKGTEIKEEKIEEFTVEIKATPEPYHHHQATDRTVLLPNLPPQDLRKRKHLKPHLQHTVSLPEINTSSSSSTPDNLNEKLFPIEGKTKKCHPLPIVNGRKKSSRHEIRMKRERVTAFEKIPKNEPQLHLPAESSYERSRSTKAVEVAMSEHSVSSITSSTIILSESPSPRTERRSKHRHHSSQLVQQQNLHTDRSGSSWTVTVAGSSGNLQHSPPDVEMRLTFGNKQSAGSAEDARNEDDKRLVHINPKKSSQSASMSKRKGRMIEEYTHSARNERQSSLQYLPGMVFQNSKAELSHSISHKEVGGYFDADNISQISRRSKGSIDGGSDATSLCSDLQVTGLAITPESKPYVPTQSERDLVRRQRYKFTR